MNEYTGSYKDHPAFRELPIAARLLDNQQGKKTMTHTQATPTEIARDIADAHDLKTVEQARDYLIDDRSHGDEYVADAAGDRGLWNAYSFDRDDMDDPFVVVAFIEVALRRAEQARERDEVTA